MYVVFSNLTFCPNNHMHEPALKTFPFCTDVNGLVALFQACSGNGVGLIVGQFHVMRSGRTVMLGKDRQSTW